MARDSERRERASETPVVGGLPNAPGIQAAMLLAPSLEGHLRGLADALLVEPFPGSTLTRGERESLATAVSAANDCFFCMDSHGAFACELLTREGADEQGALDAVDDLKTGGHGPFGPKVAALLTVARRVALGGRRLERSHVDEALARGATDGDVQLAVLIASGFSMYNRAVDGLRAMTAPDPAAYRERARSVAESGYAGAGPVGMNVLRSPGG